MKLKFICDTDAASQSDVVIYQKNLASYIGSLTVAWKVIKKPGKGDTSFFSFSQTMQLATINDSGNETSQQDVAYGELWETVRIGDDDILMLAGNGSSTEEVQLQNNLSSGSITGNIYRDNKLAATTIPFNPGQQAEFQFLPDLWMGVVPKADEGEVLSWPMIEQLNSQVSFLGVASAEIVMTRGGSGPNSPPFSFAIKNVRSA